VNDKVAARLVFDGIRLILQVLVEMDEQNTVPIPRELSRDIQRWFDDCYRLLEDKEPP